MTGRERLLRAILADSEPCEHIETLVEFLANNRS